MRELYGWESRLSGLDASCNVIAVNESAIVTDIMGGWVPPAAFVRRIDDASLGLLSSFYPAPWPVHLYFPDSLDRVGEIRARELTIISSDRLAPDPLYTLHEEVEQFSLNADVPRGSLDLPHFARRLKSLNVAWGALAPGDCSDSRLEELGLIGFAAKSIWEIPALSSLTGLFLQEARRLHDLEGINRFPALVQLSIHAARRMVDIRQVADLLLLRELEFSECVGIGDISALQQCLALEELTLSDCRNIHSMAPLSQHPRLEILQADGSTRVTDDDLSPILTIPHLRHLALASRRSYHPSVHEVRTRMNLTGA